MLEIRVTAEKKIELKYAVFDYNGTLAIDGVPEKNVIPQLLKLNEVLQVYILSADTFGRVRAELGQYPFKIHILSAGSETEQKKTFVENLGAQNTVAFGNGNNDTAMLRTAALGIGVTGGEGMSGSVLQNADIIVGNISDGIGLLLNPLRIKATLRS